MLQGIMLDITEKKMMEDELAKHRYQLEKQVEHRTAALERRISTLETSNARLIEMLEERETALRQLRAEGGRNRQAMDLLEEAVLQTNAAGNVVEMNSAALRLLGLEGEAALPRSLQELVHLDPGPGIGELCQRCLGARPETVDAHVTLLVQGERRMLALRCAPVLGSDRLAIGVVLVLAPARG
jgi:PAS domain-containing protein